MSGIRAPIDKDEEERFQQLVDEGFGKSIQEVLTDLLGNEICSSIIVATEFAISQALKSGESIDPQNLGKLAGEEILKKAGKNFIKKR